MSEKPPLYNHTPNEESESQDPSTTSQPQNSMNTAAENYMSRYNSTITTQYPDGTPSSPDNQGQLHHPISQWDLQSPTYREVHPNIYYNSGNPMDVANTQYTSPYPRWASQAPVQCVTHRTFDLWLTDPQIKCSNTTNDPAGQRILSAAAFACRIPTTWRAWSVSHCTVDASTLSTRRTFEYASNRRQLW
jgi:hypothetical protein